jgi:hypothetical protein
MMKGAVVTALSLLAACASSGASNGVRPNAVELFDDSRTGQSLGHFLYAGRWEHISNRHDGRYDGTSSRSRHSGDTITLPFDGSLVRIYGVRGPNGGDAAIGIDGQYYGTATFYSPHKESHALVFASPQLSEGTHSLGLVVKFSLPSSHRGYVNIDEVEVLHR